MRPRRVAEPRPPIPIVPRRSLRERVLLVLWPAFLMAGVLEMMLFAVVDPSSLQWFGVEPIEWSRHTIYSVTFLIFWAVISVSAAMTVLLEAPGHPSAHDEPEEVGTGDVASEAPARRVASNRNPCR